jgi:hypothetical protein
MEDSVGMIANTEAYKNEGVSLEASVMTNMHCAQSRIRTDDFATGEMGKTDGIDFIDSVQSQN